MKCAKWAPNVETFDDIQPFEESGKPPECTVNE